MRILVENNTIKIRREGIFLCLDGSRRSNWWDSLYQFLDAQSKNLDIPLKMGLLSWGEVLNGIPDQRFLDSRKISRRGRFITPLVESVFQVIAPKEYDLVIFAEEDPYDLKDWDSDFSKVFNRIYMLKESALGNTGQEMEDALIKMLFDAKLDQLLLRFDSSLPYEFNEGFRLNLEQGKLSLVNNIGSGKADVELKVCSPKKDSTVIVNDAFQFDLPSTWPELVTPKRTLGGQGEVDTFLAALNCYKSGQNEHHCPLCGKPHVFKKAFTCSKQRDPAKTFSQESLIFTQIGKQATETRFVVFRVVDSSVTWEAFDLPVIRVQDRGFVVIPGVGKAAYAEMSKQVQFQDATEVFTNLYSLPNQFYLLKIGGI